MIFKQNIKRKSKDHVKVGRYQSVKMQEKKSALSKNAALRRLKHMYSLSHDSTNKKTNYLTNQP